MPSPSVRDVIRLTNVAVHLVVGGALVVMTIPSFGNIARQLQSGYVPSGYVLYPIVVIVAIALGGSILVGLVRWARGSRRTLVGVDIAVLLASWSFLVVFVFSNDLPIVSWALSPFALILALRTPAKSPEATPIRQPAGR